MYVKQNESKIFTNYNRLEILRPLKTKNVFLVLKVEETFLTFYTGVITVQGGNISVTSVFLLMSLNLPPVTRPVAKFTKYT